jgi:uncharacterized protein DUF6519/carboxypeptidase family protein
VKSDSSRDTFRATKHYAQVRMQQGRVQVDADWNEQGEIIEHRIETESLDTIGPAGGPLHDAGFQILAPATGTPAGNFQISAGRFYVDGILCINDAATTFTAQPDLPGATAVSGAASLYVAYLDVWQRHLTALDDPSIREVALGGPDTATRVKTVWQVKLFNAGNVQGNCLTPFPTLNAVQAPQTGRLAARTKQEAGSTNPCIVPPGAGYRGLENQLYRVEVHGTGTGQNVNSPPASFVVTPVANKPNQVTFTTGTWSVGQPIEMVSVKPGASPMNGTLATISAVDENAKIITLNSNLAAIDPADLRFRLVGATFKWSRDNGAIVTAVENVNGAEVTVHDLGPDSVLGFREGGWVEYIDDAMELNGQPGILAQVLKIDRAVNVVTLSAAPPPLVVSGGIPNLSRHPKLRVWHGVGAIKFRPGGAPADDLELENGVMIRFTGGTFRNGDYWTIPARTATADALSGNVEWPTAATGPVDQLPFGIRHHYSRLAMLQWNGTAFASISDCRNLFPPVTELTTLVYVSGDGQEAMPNNDIPQPLMVGVFNGRWPVNGVRVRFTAEANGRLAPAAAGLPGTVNTVTVVTGPAGGNPDGIASCAWRLDPDVTNTSQQVEARLLDANGDPTPSIIRFNGNHSIASQVAYDPGQCTSMQGRGTVQTAIDQLARLVSLYEVSGGHQDIVPGATLEPLIVLAANRCGPVPGRRVTFKVAAGAGTLSAPEATTDANGRATVTWTPDPTTLRQQVEATLVDDPPVSVAAPTTVRFVANLTLSREPGIHIVQITSLTDNAALENDTVVPVTRLEKGITVFCDDNIVPTSVGPAPNPITFPQATPFKPTCFITLDLPYPIGGDTNFWDFNAIVGYQPLILAANVAISGREIRWTLTDNANRWLLGLFFQQLQGKQVTDRVLAHLTLKGNFIWSGTTAATQKHLDGDVFGRPGTAGRTTFDLPSGDNRKGGDFEMWFWLSPRPAAPAGPNFDFTVTPNRTIQGTFRDPTGGALPGLVITLIPAIPTVAPRTVATDANGAFTFNSVTPGNYTLSVSFLGVAVTRPVTVP